jgi:hypothetical protein
MCIRPGFDFLQEVPETQAMRTKINVLHALHIKAGLLHHICRVERRRTTTLLFDQLHPQRLGVPATLRVKNYVYLQHTQVRLKLLRHGNVLIIQRAKTNRITRQEHLHQKVINGMGFNRKNGRLEESRLIFL